MHRLLQKEKTQITKNFSHLLASKLSSQEIVQLLFSPSHDPYGEINTPSKGCLLRHFVIRLSMPNHHIPEWEDLFLKLDPEELVVVLEAVPMNFDRKESVMHELTANWNTVIESEKEKAGKKTKKFGEFIARLLQKLQPEQRTHLLFDIKNKNDNNPYWWIERNLDKTESFLGPLFSPETFEPKGLSAGYCIAQFFPAIITGAASRFTFSRNPLQNAAAQLCAAAITISTSHMLEKLYNKHTQLEKKIQKTSWASTHGLVSMAKWAAIGAIELPFARTVLKGLAKS